MKYSAQGGSPLQGKQSGYNLRNYNFTECDVWSGHLKTGTRQE